MVKLMFFCRRRVGTTHERYTQRLLKGHVPLALKHHPTLRRYVVNIVDHSPPGWDELDSVGELGFDRLEDFRDRLYASPEGQAIVERDVAGFMGGADAYATTEYIQRSPSTHPTLGVRSPGIKLVCPLIRRPDFTHEGFVRHWLTQHVPLALQHHPGMIKYVTNVVDQRLGKHCQELDGIAELYFPSRDALAKGMFDSAEGERIIRDDIVRFIGRTAAYQVAEYVQKI